MYALADEANSPTVGNEERATGVQSRLEALGISDREFAERTGIDRKALRRAANGEAVRPSTYAGIESWLARLEHELGMDRPDLPEGARYVGDPADNLVEFTVEGNFGVRAVVKGPIRDLDALQAAVSRLIAGMHDETSTTDKP